MPSRPAYDGSPGAEAAALLRTEIAALRGRLERFSAQQWAAPAGSFATRERAVHHLAERLAVLAWRLSPPPPGLAQPRLPWRPAEGVALDQLAVTADDLDRELGDGVAPQARAAVVAALSEVVLHRWDVVGSVPTPHAALLVLGTSASTGPASPVEQALALARERCSRAGRD
ncbi:MAG: hypothetical protein M3Z02_11025 [Actinomycetota bacterium]|nr:hypothetical protein [Actinomycetota bacterium]